MKRTSNSCAVAAFAFIAYLLSRPVHAQSALVTRWSFVSSVTLYLEDPVNDHCYMPTAQLDCSTYAEVSPSVSQQQCQGWFSNRLLLLNADIVSRAEGAQWPLRVETFGILYLNPAVESTLTFGFNCIYQRPPGYRTVLIGFQLSTYESQTTFYFNDHREAMPGFDPPVGSLELADEIVLPPFPTGYVLRYDVRLSSYTGSPSELTVADATLPIVLEPTVCRPCGDLTCDGVVDDADLPAFILAMLDPTAFAAAYPGCDRVHADMNGDGSVDGLDIREMALRLTAH